MPIETRTRKKAPCLYTQESVYKSDELVNKKAHRTDEIDKSTVTVDAGTFNTDEASMDRLDRIIDLANWKFNQAVAGGATPEQAYSLVYLTTLVPWKLADNSFGTFNIETLCRVQELALNDLNAIWVKYE